MLKSLRNKVANNERTKKFKSEQKKVACIEIRQISLI